MKTFTHALATAAALIALLCASPPARADTTAANRTAVVELSTPTSAGGKQVLQRAYLLLPPGQGNAELEIAGAGDVGLEIQIAVDKSRGDAIPFRLDLRHQAGRGDAARITKLHVASSATRGKRMTIGRLARSGGSDVTVSLTIQ